MCVRLRRGLVRNDLDALEFDFGASEFVLALAFRRDLKSSAVDVAWF
jgi:hypothetical protein